MERNYTITELECLAIVWAVRHFRPYLYGMKFTVVTDHNALKWLMTIHGSFSRLVRWLLNYKNMIWRLNTDPYRLVVSSKFRKELLKQTHDSIMAGHLGIRKTYLRLSSKYYWKGMYRDVVEHVSSCVECNMRKGDPNNLVGKYESLITEKPLELIAMDIIGPLPRGNLYILLFIDHFTRWVEIAPMRKDDSRMIAEKFVKHIFCRHGAPDYVMTDCGSNFTLKILQEVMDVLLVEQIWTAAYHHQANGLVEEIVTHIHQQYLFHWPSKSLGFVFALCSLLL
jgi:hypothetical protein